MFCRDKGLSVVPDTLFKVSKLRAVTRVWTPAREGKKAAYSSFLRGKQLLPFEGAALLLKMFYLKVFFQLMYREVSILCLYQIYGVSFWEVVFVIFCLKCYITCRYTFIYCYKHEKFNVILNSWVLIL